MKVLGPLRNRLPSSSSSRQVVLTFAAQIYNQSVTIGVQFLLVPVLLQAWGVQLYGAWLLLSAVPTYLTFSDFGFTLSAKNEMTMQVARGNRKSALSIFQSIFMLISMVLLSIFIVSAALLFFIDPGSLFDLSIIDRQSGWETVALLSANVLLTQYMLLFAAGIRCGGRAPEEALWSASSRFSEGLVTGLAAALGGGIVTAAGCIVLSKLVFIAALRIRLRQLEPWLELGTSKASRAEIRRLANPSISFMCQTLAQVVLIQGPIIVLGAVSEPYQVVVFSTSRTLARIGTAGVNMLNYSFMPQYSKLLSLSSKTFNDLWRVHLTLTLIIAPLYFLTFIISGPSILAIWTHGKIGMNPWLLTILAASVVLEMVWTAMFVPLASFNLHVWPSYIFGLLSVIAVGCSVASGKAFGLEGVATPVLVVNAVMIGIVSLYKHHEVGLARGQEKQRVSL